jgi:hypothetical protein
MRLLNHQTQLTRRYHLLAAGRSVHPRSAAVRRDFLGRQVTLRRYRTPLPCHQWRNHRISARAGLRGILAVAQRHADAPQQTVRRCTRLPGPPEVRTDDLAPLMHPSKSASLIAAKAADSPALTSPRCRQMAESHTPSPNSCSSSRLSDCSHSCAHPSPCMATLPISSITDSLDNDWSS